MAGADQHLGISTAPHGLGFAPNGDLHAQDRNQTGPGTTLRQRPPRPAPADSKRSRRL